MPRKRKRLKRAKKKKNKKGFWTRRGEYIPSRRFGVGFPPLAP